ncbi:hypothetical protein R83H12_00238 [Fibrobacteria bacterium R8-3-H12]
MQKKFKSLLLVAALVASAAMVFLACGTGEAIALSVIEKEIDESGKLLGTNIEDGSIYNNYEPPAEPSSSSEQPNPPSDPSSSSQPPAVPSSSSVGTTPSPTPSSSSRGSGNGSSSSRSTTVSSSSSPPAQTGDCGAATNSPSSSCGWNKTIVIGGDQIAPTGDNVTRWAYKDSEDEVAPCKSLTGGIGTVSGKTYFLWAIKNDASVYCGKIKAATKPTLSGTCTWSKNPTSAATGAKPSGVTLSDGEVCNGANVVYKNGSTTWPTNGIVPAGEYSNVKATVDCGSINVEPKSCEKLVVNAAEAKNIVCEGGWNASDCEGSLERTIEEGECISVSIINPPAGNEYHKPADVTLKMRCETEGTPTANESDRIVSFSMTYTTSGEADRTYKKSGNYSAEQIYENIGVAKAGETKNPMGKVCLISVHNITKVKCTLGP